MNERRESTLVEWCERLENDHRVNIEFNKLRETIGLLNSMILSGESYTPTSEEIVMEAINILKGVSGGP